jgi:hypothetical protein
VELLIIGTGAEIPPKGWGAVEAIIAEHLIRLPRQNVNVSMVNTCDWYSIVSMAKDLNKKFDFVHFHYDLQWPYAKCMSSYFPTAMTSHFPYVGTESYYAHYGYWKVMDYFLDDTHQNYNFCISDKDIQYFISKGGNPDKIFRLKLGASEDIRFAKEPVLADRSIYLGKVSHRKRQAVYGSYNFMDFAGNLESEHLAMALKHYLGEWSKDQVNNTLTEYGNLVLLSDGENTPLVIREALIAGLGVVCSESCLEELDEQPFITIIPNNQLENLAYVQEKIEENRAIALKMRPEICNYGVQKFGWDSCVKHYVGEIERALS